MRKRVLFIGIGFYDYDLIIQQAIENHDYSAKRIGNVLSITSDFKAISNDRLEIFDETTETISVKKENKIFIINKSDLKDN